MNIKEKLQSIYEAVDRKFVEQFGFQMKDVTFNKIVQYLHEPKDSSSLAVTRILFGLAMLFDIPDERGGATMELRWGDPKTCHFPLLPMVTALPMPYMALVYAALWFGALGIMLGYKYRFSAVIFTVCYWYLLLIEKSYWNNHSYLFGLVALLLTCTQANCYWSVDAYQRPTVIQETVPYWNYFILKYQFFILYFMAGMKKGTAEWLTGYSVQRLSEHWVFEPFKWFLTVPQIDYFIVHWFIFVFDLTVAIWMMWSRTRHVAMCFCALFHLMNSRLFRIGMFPWVCLATMPLYYPFHWPKIMLRFLKKYHTIIKNKFCYLVSFMKTGSARFYKCNKNNSIKDKIVIEDNTKSNDSFINNDKASNENIDPKSSDHNVIIKKSKSYINEDKQIRNCDTDDSIVTRNNKLTNNKDVTSKVIKNETDSDNADIVNFRKKVTTCLIFFYVFTQAFLPYSHFITKGYNNWTNGLYGYSWDMMVHSWDTHSVVVKIVDNNRHKDFFLDPYMYTLNDRWTRHGDMVYQYAQCLKKNLIKEARSRKIGESISMNLSIYIDVWCSMNGRFTQRLFDSKVDLLKATWSPFKKMSYLMPLLGEDDDWRSVLDQIREEVLSWSSHSDVIFIADFPDYELEKYIPYELKNVTLTVLHGLVAVEMEENKLRNGQSYQLSSGNRIEVDPGLFHRIINIGTKPAYYMYTFVNTTDINSTGVKQMKPKLPIVNELGSRIAAMFTFGNAIFRNILKICFFKFWTTQC